MRELCWHQPALHYESHEQGRLKSAPQTNTSDRARSWIHQVAAGDMLEEPYPDAGLITNLKSRLPRVVGACHHDRKWLNIFREFGSKLTAFIGPFCTVKLGAYRHLVCGSARLHASNVDGIQKHVPRFLRLSWALPKRERSGENRTLTRFGRSKQLMQQCESAARDQQGASDTL